MVAPPNIWLRLYESNVGPNTVGDLVCCAPNIWLRPLAVVAPPHIIWLRHLGHSKSNVGPHIWLRNLKYGCATYMVAQPKYGCTTLNPM
jgi:hypothetical protein